MTEQELITAMTALTSGAQAVLQAIQNYGSQASGTVSFAVGGANYTLKCLQQQITDAATQQAADRALLMQNIGGMPTAQSVTRNSVNQLLTVSTTFATGYQSISTLTRDPLTSFITAEQIVIKDNLGVVQSTVTKTINRVNGYYSGV